MGESSSWNVCKMMGFNLSGPQPYVGSSLGEACQCFQLKCLCQAFWGRDWAGRDGQHRSHADPAATFGRGI